MSDVDQSVESDESSVVEQSESQPEPVEAQVQESTEVKDQEDKLPPFHEHPRFKEVIEQNRTYKTQMEQYQGALERLQTQMEMLRTQNAPKKETPVDQFLADLEKVNPAYANSLRPIYEKASKADQLEQRMQQYEASQFAERAQNHFKNLLDTSKITDQMDRKLYERAVKAEVYDREAKGKKLGLNDLDSIFNEFHNEYSKAMEERSRKITASYVKDKTKDTTPKGATGGAATSPVAKKIAAHDTAGQAKWLADQIRSMKKQI